MIHTLTRQVIALSLALLMTAGAKAQELIADVDRDTIGLNDTLTLTVRQSGRTVSGGPDFEALREDFDILGNQRSHQMRIVNGDMESWTEWRVNLSPKEAGRFTIPAFEFNGDRSEPIEVTVEERSAPASRDEDIFVETELDKKRVRVQEQVLMTIRLYSRVNLDGAEIQPLELDNAVVKALDEDNYITDIDGRRHIVLETTLALFPQSSGTLEIPPLVYELAVSQGQRDFWGRSRRQRVRTEGLSLDVEPVPDAFDGDTWLPARDLRLSERWGTDPEELQQGEPVTREITLEADGLTEAQLPELALGTTPAATFYPDRPQTEENISASGVRSKSTLSVAMVPNQSGPITLPPIELLWWDTEEERLRTARLPGTTVEVEPSPDAALEAPEPGSEDDEQRRNRNDDESEDEPMPLMTWFFALASAVLFGACAWFAFTVWRLKRALANREEQVRRARDRIRIDRARAWHAVKRAARGGDLHRLRRALLDWGAALWPAVPPRGLTDLADRLEDKQARARLRELDALLFRGGDAEAFDVEDLIRALNRRRAGHRADKSDDAGLKPLYHNRRE